MTATANFTRKAIKASFLKLLNQRALNKITVKDIVEDCGINRNSFYYHFQDIPALLEEIITEEAERVIAECKKVTSIEKCLDIAVAFALDNKTAVMHIYNSVNRDIYEQYLWRVCQYAVTSFIDTVFPECKFSAADRELIIRFYKCECFGIAADWMNSGMDENVHSSYHRLFELRSGMTEELLRRCTEKK